MKLKIQKQKLNRRYFSLGWKKKVVAINGNENSVNEVGLHLHDKANLGRNKTNEDQAFDSSIPSINDQSWNESRFFHVSLISTQRRLSW